jgi:diaminopimelate epimerase
MKINFYKYQGTGNDFIIFDNRNNDLPSFTTEQVAHLCHRRFGIGADGVILLNPHTHYDFEMKYYNADGNEGSMCGNGGRCLVKFAYDLGIVKTAYKFIAFDGEHEASVTEKGLVALKMNDVNTIKEVGSNYILNTGSPHYIHMENSVNDMNVVNKGREIRYKPEFEKEGINVNFVELIRDSHKIKVRTYERGVEDETYSCGTGVTAAAIVCYHNDEGFNQVQVETKGGKLSVEYDKEGNAFKNIWLIGPAEQVFQGTIDLKKIFQR